MEKLLKFIADHASDEVSRLILDKRKYPEIDIELAVNTIECRRKLKSKVKEWAESSQLVFPSRLSAEQCSSSATARYKADLAERIISHRGKETHKSTIADLTGGLGVDSWFFSKKVDRVIYNEMQEALCNASRHNFNVLGSNNIEILNSQITADICLKSHLSSPDGIDLIYIDPARRGEGGKKVFLIEECTPDVLTLKEEIFKTTSDLLIKLSPMADISLVCNRLGTQCREVHIVSTGGECKELLIWMDREWNDKYNITAVELHGDSPATSFSFKPSEEKESIYDKSKTIECVNGQLLFEPGKSLMKAGAFNIIAKRLDIRKIGLSTHYYIVDNEQNLELLKGLGKIFKVLECSPLDKRNIKRIGQEYPKADITARNIPMDTEALRKKMGIASGDDAHIFGLKSDIQGNILIVTKKI